MEQIIFEKRDVCLKNFDGSIIFEMNNIIVPSFWSINATTILASKYFRKNIENTKFENTDLDKYDEIINCYTWKIVKQNLKQAIIDKYESSIIQTVGRMCLAWANQLYINNGDNKDVSIFFEKAFLSIILQKSAPNSPQWFNCGLYEAYNIEFSNIGSYILENNEIIEVKEKTCKSQLHACFIQSINDNLIGEGGIYDLLEKEARIFKYGSGSGTNFSNLRGKNEKLSGGGNSSGLISFLKIFDTSAGSIKSGGTTRRAAKMCCLDIDHPDIEEFIDWKYNEEKKAQALISCGYSNHYEGESYTTISGQNSNNSIQICDEFMEKLKIDDDWDLKEKSTNKIAKTVKSSYLWDKIGNASWNCADPGIQYSTTINEYNTCKISGKINATNPCITGDSLINTSEGLKRIDSLLEKYFDVIGSDGKIHNIKPAFKTGNKEIYILKTLFNYELKLTSDHIVLTQNRGDVKACDLKISDLIVLQKPNFGNLNLNDNFIYVVAKYLVEYNFSDTSEVEFIIVNFTNSTFRYFNIHMLFDLNKESIFKIFSYIFNTTFEYSHNIQKLELKNLELLKIFQILLLGFGIKAQLIDYSLIFAFSQLNNDNPLNFVCYFKSLISTGKYEDVYDLTESETSHFSANCIVVHNCSEYCFLDDTACNLASINLVKFIKDNNFLIDEFIEEINICTEILNLSIDLASYPSKLICEKSLDFRTIGLGYTNLGTLLMMLGIEYSSEIGFQVAGLITSLLTSSSYLKSSDIASKKSSFPKFEENKESFMEVINKHYQNNLKLINQFKIESIPIKNIDNLIDMCNFNWNTLVTKTCFKNAQISLLAPTGTISFIMDCDTMGIEPDFSLIKYKKLSGGGNMKIINSSVENSLKTLNYSQEQINKILQYIETNNTIIGCPDISVLHSKIFYNANEIDYLSHLLMMASVQPFLSGAISKTINIPESASIEDIKNIYLKGWSLGLKAIALYRNNCKSSQPLNSTKKSLKRKFNKISNSKRFHLNISGCDIFLHTGEDSDGNLFEIFIDSFKSGSSLRAMLDNFAISISYNLQNSVSLEKLVNKFVFTDFEPKGLVTGYSEIFTCTSIIDAIFRLLDIEYNNNKRFSHLNHSDVSEISEINNKYENINIGPSCLTCGNLTVRIGTCYTCSNCSNTSGCS